MFRLDSEYILKTEPTGFPDRLDVGGEKKVKCDSQGFV